MGNRMRCRAVRRTPAILVVLAAGPLLAHGGGLDKHGCHTERATGRYHCHGSGSAPPAARTPSATSPQSAAPQGLLSAPRTTPLRGHVVGIVDGDTLDILIAGRSQRIRLDCIDAPEMGQAFGSNAKQALSEIAFSQDAEVRPITTDRYGRTVARVTVLGSDLSERMVVRGFAWNFDKYCIDPRVDRLEQIARSASSGLWRDPNSIPPWEWRHPQ